MESKRTEAMKTLKIIKLAGDEVGIEYLQGLVSGDYNAIMCRLTYLKRLGLIRKRLNPPSKTFPQGKRLFVNITKKGEYVLKWKEENASN